MVDTKEKIAIIIPYIEGEEQQANRMAKIYSVRAGMACSVYTALDKEKEGWVATHNAACKNIKHDFYLYTAVDYFPGYGFLQLAYETLKATGKGLCAFNDGKWHGGIATAGLVRKSWYEKNYPDGLLFHKGYKSHCADPELTYLAMKQKQFIYHPQAILLEIDYDKHNKKSNVKDRAEYIKRRNKCFFPPEKKQNGN